MTADRLEPVEAEYLAELVAQHAAAQAALNGYLGFISRKYGLGANDRVLPTGVLVRADHAGD